MNEKIHTEFQLLYDEIEYKFLKSSNVVRPKFWQSVDVSTKPEMVTYELLNISFNYYCTRVIAELQRDIKPNLPWADDHFEERVCGYPLNPGIQWANWPWGSNAKKFLDLDGERFNHNYMERYWPKYAGAYNNPRNTPEDFLVHYARDEPPQEQWHYDKLLINEGIRGIYGDLNDVVNLLIRDPHTRQAYLPIFFPEDTGDANIGRKPCTLGYQFIMRNNFLHIIYPMRSCDFIRHFRDDVYLTVRLLFWMLVQLRARDLDTWGNVQLGYLTMHITSLHVFKNDFLQLEQKYA